MRESGKRERGEGGSERERKERGGREGVRDSGERERGGGRE